MGMMHCGGHDALAWACCVGVGMLHLGGHAALEWALCIGVGMVGGDELDGLEFAY